MNIKEAAQTVDNPPPINWEWLAGFFQAEGSIGSFFDRMGCYYAPRITISQVEDEILYRIADFLKIAQPNTSLGVYGKKDTHPASSLVVRYRKNTQLLCVQVAPYLRSTMLSKLRETCNQCRMDVDGDVQDWSWDFVAGFWEGDGCLGRTAFSCQVNFDQADEALLQEVRDFLRTGSVFLTTGITYRLNLSDDLDNLPIHRKLLEYSRTHFRRVQLAGAILGEEHEL